MLRIKQRSISISFQPIQLTQPDPASAEISLFGPGIGECIALHYGEGRWFVIDSCLCPTTGQPIALKYFSDIGVDAETQVVGILITHWHSDHIRGAFELLKTCQRAKVYFTNALSSQEVLHLASLYKRDIFSGIDKEIRDFAEIVQYITDSGDRDRVVTVQSRSTFFDIKGDIPIRMHALSPSSQSVAQSIANLAESKPKEGARRTRNIIPQSANLNAVAVHFSFGDFSAVLGADLEELGSPHTGWSAVFGGGIIEDLSLDKAALYKVAHHGSETGHHEKIWTDLLDDSPLSITTSYTRSKLPSHDHIVRVCGLSSRFIVTRDPTCSKRIKRLPMVERELKSIAIRRDALNENMGHIQVRAEPDGSTHVAMNSACVEYCA